MAQFDYLSKIKEADFLSNSFLLPADACEVYTRVYVAFKALKTIYNL